MLVPSARALSLCLPFAIFAAAEARARCMQAGDLDALGAAVRANLACRTALLVNGGASCPDPGAPACAGSAAEQIADLVLGPTPGPVSGWTSKSLRCQRDIALASTRFVERRLKERARGRRRAKSNTAMRRITKSCGKATVEDNGLGEELVRVGVPCASVLGAVGAPIDGQRLSRCLRASLEAKIDDIAPSALAPNIVLIVTDDQRHDTFDVMPAVSALRDQSISFSNAFVTNPVCSPSRASILTGRYSHSHGVLSNGHFDQLDDSDTIATWLQSVGYTNALFGKYLNNSEILGLTPPNGWHAWRSFLDPSGGEFYGFRLNDNGVAREIGSSRYSTDWLRNEALRFIRSRSDEPFFLVYTPFAPHDPATPAHRHETDLVSYPPHRPPSWLDDVSDKPSWVQFFESIAPPEFSADVDAFRLQQLRTLLSVDEAVERILEKLEKEGLTDNTVVVFTSDHGSLWAEHWLRGKFNPYEESIRVPYMLRYPRRYPSPATRDQMVLNHDLAPTLAEFAGAPIPPDLDGTSLVPLLDSASAAWRDGFLVETLGEFITRPSESVRTEAFKYIDTAAPGGVTQELYDLVADPYERTNLASAPAYAPVLADMIARLDALRGP